MEPELPPRTPLQQSWDSFLYMTTPSWPPTSAEELMHLLTQWKPYAESLGLEVPLPLCIP